MSQGNSANEAKQLRDLITSQNEIRPYIYRFRPLIRKFRYTRTFTTIN